MTTAASTAPTLSNAQRWALRVLFWLIALGVGVVQTLAKGFAVGEDGVSYLDIADAYIRGDWHNAVNAYWGPLYSWLLALGLVVARPSSFWESSVVHGLNLLVYVGSMLSFEFLLAQLFRLHRSEERELKAHGDMRLPEGGLRVLAYGLFIWVCFEWLPVPLETPDMTMSIFVFLASGMLVRMRTRAPPGQTLFAFGVVLGLGYLTKGAMLPLSLFFFALAYSALARQRRPRGAIVLALAGFLILAIPYVAAMSMAKGRLTTGDTGKLAYAWFANGSADTDREHHWHRLFPDEHRPVHPTRRVLKDPATYEYGSDPVGGTYPPFFDPSYWHEGVKAHFDPRGQLRVLRWSAIVAWQVFVTDGGPLLPIAFILLAVGFQGWRQLRRDVRSRWDLILPFAAALAMYSLVLLSPRYIAVFVLLFWIGVFSSVRLPDSVSSRRLAWSAPIALLLMLALGALPDSYVLLRTAREQTVEPERTHTLWRVAQGLQQLGAKPGDGVAEIGYGASAYWARLAHVRMVGETLAERQSFAMVPGAEHLFEEDGSMKAEAVKAFSGMSAKIVVATWPPSYVTQHGWKPLGEGTGWYGYLLPQ
jgi:hypothetical protein